jgi:hypothetical protein
MPSRDRTRLFRTLSDIQVPSRFISCVLRITRHGRHRGNNDESSQRGLRCAHGVTDSSAMSYLIHAKITFSCEGPWTMVGDIVFGGGCCHLCHAQGATILYVPSKEVWE